MTPMQIERFRLTRPQRKDVKWLQDTLTREGREFGTQIQVANNGRLSLQWQEHTPVLQDV